MFLVAGWVTAPGEWLRSSLIATRTTERRAVGRHQRPGKRRTSSSFSPLLLALPLPPPLSPLHPWSYFYMSKKRKRISRRRLAGQRVLAHVPTFNLETGSHKPVTAARRFIAETELQAPAILNVRRNEHTTDRFFWGEKGLFSAQYAEENHFLFPSLRLIVDRIGEDVLFEGIEALAADDWEEVEEYEYAFV
jgi:Protein of unknown function (DUF3155)